MRIVFKKIPKIALVLYCIGFLMILVAMFLYFKWPDFISVSLYQPILLQQVFIVGAIIVAIGSIFNNIYQFRLNRDPENIKEE